MTNPTPSAFPLQWPSGWPRTEGPRRESARFKTDLAAALRNLNRELGLMGAKAILLSSNYTLGINNPKDPGVVAYFTWEDQPMSIPCDRWDRIQANVQAIALTVEAMRGMERWGAKHMIRAMFTGFKALPQSGEHWSNLFGVSADASVEQVRAIWRGLCKTAHPDTGGSKERFLAVQQAWEQFCKERGIS